MKPEFTIRERQVFLAIVHGFVQNAEPVGSRFIAKHYDLNISPATIRNVMADLEEKGLIWQPHTSAGRMPTTFGYRAYVDSLKGDTELSELEQAIIIDKMANFSKNADVIIKKTARVLSEISNQLGVVLSPRFAKGFLDKIELVQLSGQKLLLVLSVSSGLVKSVIVEIEAETSASFLKDTASLINERLHGLSIEKLTESLQTRFIDVDDKSKALINAIGSSTDDIIQLEPEGDFYFAGAHHVIQNPEFNSQEQVGRILELLDNKDILVRVLSDQNKGGVSIVIGEENKEALMQNCSIITTTYQMDGANGMLGVIGPTRMQYAKIISLVQFISDTLHYLVSKANN
jgi:heat-inducible transcriptional repressor